MGDIESSIGLLSFGVLVDIEIPTSSVCISTGLVDLVVLPVYVCILLASAFFSVAIFRAGHNHLLHRVYNIRDIAIRSES